MVTAVVGTSKVRVPRPSLTYTNTLARLPPSATMVSAEFAPLQAASWLMSILAALGAAPSSFTVPLTLATVAGSIGVAVGAAGAAASGAAAGGASSFLLQPARTKPRQSRPITAIHLFVFMMSTFRGVLNIISL